MTPQRVLTSLLHSYQSTATLLNSYPLNNTEGKHYELFQAYLYFKRAYHFYREHLSINTKGT